MEKKEAEVEAQHQVGVEAILAQQKALEAKHQDEIAAAKAKWEQRLATLQTQQTQQLQQGAGSFSAESERKRDARERELMESMSKLTETVTQLKNKRSSICTIC